MPVWITVIASIITLIILVGGALNFPYVPMWFGIYGAERESTQGKFVYKLILAFPALAIISLILGWTISGFYALLPIAYIAVVWAIRPNQGDSHTPETQYADSGQNLDARLAEIDFRWTQWASQSAPYQYLLFTLSASSTETAERLKSTLTASENLHSEIEISTYDNGTATVYVRVKLEAIDKSTIITIVKRIVDTAWKTNCELSSVDVMEGE